ncbi:MAG: type II toxin-antitoxin system RelE/ParE family toxin [Eubacterium sp.]|nr:type II toxin-antitoxin system RelE/ParE family toxin [Eubacterium sp.]
MSYEISITPQAKSDLRSIYEYIAFDLQSPQNAASQLDCLEESIDSLDEMPERFRVYDKEPWHSRNLRIMPVDNYLVFYIPNHKENVVMVIRVMYGGREVDRQLNQHLGRCRELRFPE